MVKINLSDSYFDHFKDIYVDKKTELSKLLLVAHCCNYKSYSKILWATNKLQFTSVWELKNLLSISDQTQIKRCLNYFIYNGVITIMKDGSEDYTISEKFWKMTYRTSPFTPAFYKITSAWKGIIKLFDKPLSKYCDFDVQNNIHRRKTAFSEYHGTIISERETYLKRKRIAIGHCHNCGTLISSSAKRGTDYHKYPIGLICSHCNKIADIETMRKWRQNGRK